jgi:hypothetical protein
VTADSAITVDSTITAQLAGPTVVRFAAAALSVPQAEPAPAAEPEESGEPSAVPTPDAAREQTQPERPAAAPEILPAPDPEIRPGTDPGADIVPNLLPNPGADADPNAGADRHAGCAGQAADPASP